MRFILVTFLLCFTVLESYATHNRAGEITYRWLNNLRFEITVTTYTKQFDAADRPKLRVSWGDGTWDSVIRIARIPIPNAFDIVKNTYTTQHNFPGPGNYTISVEDPNRNGGIRNIPNSLYTVFYIESVLSINPLVGNNNSVQLLYPPIDKGCVNKLFVHNPNAYDPDGDSISYELVTCKGENGDPIIGYTLPQATNFIRIDPITGDFIWNTPNNTSAGEYNIAILIKEWRNGILVGSVTRDMQIVIGVCPNNPPVIVPPVDTCIVAGTFIQKTVTASDPDGDILSLSATGGPFNVSSSPATFPLVTNTANVSSTFSWATNCTHIRKEPYQVLFRAIDADTFQLTDLKTWRIRIIAPKVTNLKAVSIGGKITLNWDQHACNNAVGYIVYRKTMPSGWNPDSCEYGVPDYTGFKPIDTLFGINSNTFTDLNLPNGLSPGTNYCYRITAFFTNFIFLPETFYESLASDETCQIVLKDLPTITLADVSTTSNNGTIVLNWTQPTELDTIQFPGPWRYELYRSIGIENGQNQQLITSFTAQNFLNWNDTAYIDNTANTQNQPYTYQLKCFYKTDSLLGFSLKASSTFLSISPRNEALRLSWDYSAPWVNDSTQIYRTDSGIPVYLNTVIGTNTYTDFGLENGKSYCYKVITFGNIQILGRDSIVNRSQEICAIPKDTIPPCPPTPSATADCDNSKNTVKWINQTGECSEDIMYFEIWFKDAATNTLTRIDTVLNTVFEFVHENLTQSQAGCYYIKAVDSSLNVSVFSDSTCVDNCPEFSLPNVFTPNSDGINEVWKTSKKRHINSIDLKVFNRWGQMVYETKDPNFNWDGKNYITGLPLVNAVYYFSCEIFEIRLSGLVPRRLNGTISIVK